jgi:hypothetical protein
MTHSRQTKGSVPLVGWGVSGSAAYLLWLTVGGAAVAVRHLLV